ncbi:hypothetical protein ACMAY8_08275 [Rhodobacteraceae bacterium nBUS_22]|jgi:hypothetical protein|nr:hypothetical protein [Paracoccaceae bacterium]
MTIDSAIEDLTNAILDLQLADFNTYQRPVNKMALAINDPALLAINKKLKDGVDFENFIENSNSGGSMIGSANLNWPSETVAELGLAIQIIERAGSDPNWLEQFALNWYYDGNNIIRSIQKLTRSVFVPFARDYRSYLDKNHLHELGAAKISPAAKQVAVDLRNYVENISDQETRAFVEEAIQCHEYNLYRSAIVMSWLAAMDVLLKYVHLNHLDDFNNESKRFNNKWKVAKTPDDIAIMKESDFLDRITAISMIGKNSKEELKKALGLRNGCGHANTLQVGANISAAHIETLLQNVFKKFL